VSQLSWDAGAVGKLTYKTGANSRARFRVGVTATNATHLDYLDGSRWNVSGEEHWQWGSWDFTAQVHGSAVFAGFEYAPTSNLVAACDPSNCNQLYRITYTYWSPGVTAAAGWDATAALHLSLEQRVDYRGYLDASGVAADKTTQKFRKDWQFRTRARAEYALDDEDIFQLTLEQGLLVSRSNMAQGAGGNSHRFDYADRNFVESTTELGVEASW
jgi:hypothetical protein